MELHHTVTSILFFFFFFTISNSLQFCREYCSRTGDEIRFPFGLASGRCSYPGFNLSCSGHGQTVLTLPISGDFIVQGINYADQEIFINDPDNCLPRRFLINNFTLSGSPFDTKSYQSFTFLNCSSNFSPEAHFPSYSRRVNCLSSDNYTVMAVLNDYGEQFEPSFVPLCTVMGHSVEVPISGRLWSEAVMSLTWREPDCVSCEQRGGTCGFKDDNTLEVGCDLPSKAHAIPRSAKYGIIIGIGIPGLLCIIGLGCFVCGRLRTFRHGRHSSLQLPATFPHPPTIATAGLDGPTLELYPKTLLGESRRLPKPNDNTCPICLSEYKPKETLRTIPECNHYFHADCIDEWLKMNATCPLCRNSPDIASLATPSSLSASSTATTPSSSSSSSRYSGP